MDKYIYFDGLKFTRDDKTGYYLNSTIRKRLHRYVWEYHNGEIPKGYHVHHADHDKSNNDISNLVLVNPSEHASYHGDIRAETEREKIIENLDKNARPKASEWHRSEEGREWHKKLYEETKEKLHEKTELTCEQCGDTFEGIKRSRFCSNKCKAKWRRDSGIDDEVRNCEYCGKEFTVNKYSKAKCCSRTCSNRLNPRLPQLRKN